MDIRPVELFYRLYRDDPVWVPPLRRYRVYQVPIARTKRTPKQCGAVGCLAEGHRAIILTQGQCRRLYQEGYDVWSQQVGHHQARQRR